MSAPHRMLLSILLPIPGALSIGFLIESPCHQSLSPSLFSKVSTPVPGFWVVHTLEGPFTLYLCEVLVMSRGSFSEALYGSGQGVAMSFGYHLDYFN